MKPIRAFLNLKLHWQILIALCLGVVFGVAVNAAGGESVTLAGPLTFVNIFTFLGDLFLRALKMIIVPLIATSIINGVTGVGSAKALGRIGLKTFLYYMLSSLVAILVGLLVVNLIQPGVIGGQPAKDLLGLEDVSQIEKEVEGSGMGSIVSIFMRMIPDNPIKAAAEGDILAVIFFCLLFGFFITTLKDKQRETLTDFFDAAFEVTMRVTQFIIAFAPIGVFGLIAKTTSTTGLDVFIPLAKYFLTVLVAYCGHFFIVLPLVLRFVARVNPLDQYRAMAPALLTAFSTSSSSATLPLTIECMEKNAGVSNRICSFTLPLGATVNMDGTALYECVAALFIAQAYGLDMSFGVQFIVVITALLASIGTAGIPSAGLVMIAIILNALNWPLEGVGLILAVDRPLDMLRTGINVFSDSCAATVIASSEGIPPTYPLIRKEDTHET